MATNSDNILKDRAYEIGLNPKYDGHQRRLAISMYNFFDKKNKIKSDKPKGSKCKWNASSRIKQTSD